MATASFQVATYEYYNWSSRNHEKTNLVLRGAGVRTCLQTWRGTMFMKTLSAMIIVLTFLALPVSLDFIDVAAQQKTMPAKIYFRKSGSSNDPKNPYNLDVATRQVPAHAPLRSALEALTAEPTAAEEAEGFMSSTFGIKLVSVRVRNGIAYTRFTMPPGAAFPGDGAPFLFIDAVEKTAKQFSTVKKVFVCLDGMLNFGDESGEPTKPCPREPK
jgi:Sporulation and spore germination